MYICHAFSQKLLILYQRSIFVFLLFSVVRMNEVSVDQTARGAAVHKTESIYAVSVRAKRITFVVMSHFTSLLTASVIALSCVFSQLQATSTEKRDTLKAPSSLRIREISYETFRQIAGDRWISFEEVERREIQLRPSVYGSWEKPVDFSEGTVSKRYKYELIYDGELVDELTDSYIKVRDTRYALRWLGKATDYRIPLTSGETYHFFSVTGEACDPLGFSAASCFSVNKLISTTGISLLSRLPFYPTSFYDYFLDPEMRFVLKVQSGDIIVWDLVEDAKYINNDAAFHQSVFPVYQGMGRIAPPCGKVHAYGVKGRERACIIYFTGGQCGDFGDVKRPRRVLLLEW